MADMDLGRIADDLRSNVNVKTRSYHLQKFEACFLGSDAVDALVKLGVVSSRTDAVEIGGLLQTQGLFKHVTGDQDFKDAKLFYRFAEDEKNHGYNTKDATWGAVADEENADGSFSARHSIKRRESSPSALADGSEATEVLPSPMDKHNVKLLDLVKPPAWVDPKPAKLYNMVVIGGGTGGLVTAAASAGLGARVALIEQHMMGGDCLNIGCVPSKALIRCAKAIREVKGGAEYGIVVDPSAVSVDFGKVMERMRRLRADIAPVDSAPRFSKELGIDVFQGKAEFISKSEVRVNGQTLKFSKCTIATGGRARCPPVQGLKECEYLDNATLFNLTELPKRFGVLGAGPIGVEMAQSFAAFGASVSVFEAGPTILGREDEDAAKVVQEWLVKDGALLRLSAKIKSVDQTGGKDTGEPKVIRVSYTNAAGEEVVEELDELLVSAGRTPNIEGIGLDKAGVIYNSRGITIDDYLRTSNKSIFAVGDVCSKYQFTHVADFMARKVVRNALFFKATDKLSSMQVPWSTYTSPEIAHVGAYERELKADNVAYDTYMVQLDDVDRAILEGDREKSGFVKITTKKKSDLIIGATVVAENAGDIISEISVAMQSKVGLAALSKVIHPYPTVADAVRKCGDQFNKTRLSPAVKSLFRYLMKQQR